MASRREFFAFSSAAIVARAAASLTPRQRVDRALAGQDVDRSPFTIWYHFLDETKSAAQHARSTLDFHSRFRTDLVKVMSDYPYPKPAAEWFELKVEGNPFPQQIRALEQVRDGLGGQAHFVETVFNPYKIAEKLSSEDAVLKLKTAKPRKLLDALEAIAKSEANHARKAIAVGASGVFLAIANSADPDYAQFSEPFDRMVLDAVKGAPLNVLHIHGDNIDLARFYKGWHTAGINYSTHGTGIPVAELRAHYSGTILAGIDEANYRKLTSGEIARQHQEARRAAGAKFILTPGCSVPNETPDDEMLRLTGSLGA